MIPVFLDPAKLRVALIGRGDLALRRLQWLRDAGAAPELWSDRPSLEFAAAGGAQLNRGLPDSGQLAKYHAIWIADLPAEEAATVAAAARTVRVLVNVEDAPALCDFQTPAVVRRGRLTLAAGTGGASPAVARAARERLEEAFDESWGEALEDIAEARTRLREAGAGGEALVGDARARLAAHGLN